jgi:hypothetical protein
MLLNVEVEFNLCCVGVEQVYAGEVGEVADPIHRGHE